MKAILIVRLSVLPNFHVISDLVHYASQVCRLFSLFLLLVHSSLVGAECVSILCGKRSSTLLHLHCFLMREQPALLWSWMRWSDNQITMRGQGAEHKTTVIIMLLTFSGQPTQTLKWADICSAEHVSLMDASFAGKQRMWSGWPMQCRHSSPGAPFT